MKIKCRLFAAVALVCLTSPSSAQFPHENLQVLAHMPLDTIGGGSMARANDIWGWTDPDTQREFAIFGMRDRTTFIEVTDPVNPTYLGVLPSHTDSSTWRDMKVFDNYAYIVADSNGPHGLQIFDLTQLLDVTTPQQFTHTAHFDGFREAHNIAINEQSGFAYIVGSEHASGGLHILDINNPLAPVHVGDFSQDGYTHDTQVVNYVGPDSDYSGQEIAFNSNTDTLTVVDVSDKSAPVQISRTSYPDRGYTHQGWLSEDQRYFFLDDELDEFSVLPGLTTTRTHLWDVSDLDDPQYLGFHEGNATGIDHNQYVKGNYIYQANNASGLRVLRYDEEPQLALTEVAFLDTYPTSDNEVFEGAWSVFPFFDSGTVIISDRSEGLFVVRLDIADPDFDGNGVLGCADVDALVFEIVEQSHDPAFDLNVDGLVDPSDLTEWLAVAGSQDLPSGNSYLVGDANLDGTVDGQDFVEWNANKFTSLAAWCGGDFNADGNVDALDFILWNENKFQSADAIPVPAPSPAPLLACLCLTSLARRFYCQVPRDS